MKITYLKEKKLSTRSSIGASGKREFHKVEVDLKRKVKTITGGARFGHYLIDLIFIIGLNFAYGFVEMKLLGHSHMFQTVGNGFQIDFSGYVITFAYYAAFEGWLGTSPGKLALKRYVINEYAEKPAFGMTMARSLCRIVPFEAFSCLGDRGWHDKWSNTFVVSAEERDFLRKALDQDYSTYDELLDA